MALFQWQKIDPTPDEVATALAEATRSAQARRPTKAERQDALGHAQQSLAGSLTWGPVSPGGRPFRRVTCTWWADHVGRLHWFIEGAEYNPFGEPNPVWRCQDGAAAHPLSVIDPLHTAIRGEEPGMVLVVCDCGEVGTPEALGWTGDCCGPCFDRRAEGAGPPARLAAHPHKTAVIGLAFTEDDRIVSVGYRDGAVHCVDPATGMGRSLAPSSDLGGAGVAALPGAVAVAFTRAEVVCWELDSGEERWRTRCPGELDGLAVSPLGDWLAVDAVSRTYLLDTETGTGESLSDDLGYFAFGPDGTLFAYDSDSRGVTAIEVITGDTSETGLEFGEPEEDDCYSLACSPTRSLIAAGCTGGWVRIGDPATGRWLSAFERQASIVSALTFAPDGRVLASGHGQMVMFWDAEVGAVVGALGLPGTRIVALTFSPDGETLAVGDEQGVVRLWPWRRMLASGGGG